MARSTLRHYKQKGDYLEVDAVPIVDLQADSLCLGLLDQEVESCIEGGVQSLALVMLQSRHTFLLRSAEVANTDASASKLVQWATISCVWECIFCKGGLLGVRVLSKLHKGLTVVSMWPCWVQTSTKGSDLPMKSSLSRS